jgi:hypothetical protein
MSLNLSQQKDRRAPSGTISFTWVRGLELPEDVVDDDVLTAEDHRDLALDHIARTSDLIGQIRIVKKA